MNNSMKNAELLAIKEVKEAIEAGKVVLIDKKVTSNPEFTNLYFFGPTEGLRGASAEVSEAAAMLLGWNSKSTDRAIQNASTKIADNFQIGHVFPDFAIKCVDSTQPSFKGQTCRQDNEGKILYHNGSPIYRTSSIVTKAELAKSGHSVLEVTSRGAQEQPQGVNANSILEGATA